MILFIAPLADSVIAHQTLLLLSRGADFLILDPRNFGEAWNMTWNLTAHGMQGHIQMDSKMVPLERVSTVWAHMLAVADESNSTAKFQDSTERIARYTLLATFANAYPGLVINRPCRASSNGSKPYQQQIIAESGFSPIKTLITTDPEAARKFYADCRGQVIFKSASWLRSVVRRMGDEDLDRIESVKHCPTQFQEYIPGADVRVHAVGRRLFATQIESSSDDYRYVPQGGSRRMRSIELPSEIADQCRRLATALDLPICGIDLRRQPNGQYACFEVNPLPGYTFYQRQTGQPIGEAIADFICGQS